MITTLEQIAADPYTRRVMEEEELMAMNIDFWKKTIVNKDSIIAQMDSTIANKDSIIANRDSIIAQRDSIIAQRDKELEEYRRRYGKLNGATN